MEATVAERLVGALRERGVDTVFGIVSVHMLDVYDALGRDGGIRLVVPRHEQGAVHMADGYSRVTGWPGVAFTSTGPGAANAAGAMLEAWVHRSPVLHVTSQIPSPLIGAGTATLHEAKAQEEMLAAVSDALFAPASAGEAPAAIAAALDALDRPGAGPVVLQLPVDVQGQPAGPIPPPAGREALPEPDYAKAAEILAAARRPVFLVGAGAVPALSDADTRRLLVELAEALGAAVFVTPQARGAFPEDHPLSVGPLLANPVSDPLLTSGDALLALGTSFRAMNTREHTAPLPRPLIAVDPAAERIERVRVDVPVVDDPGRAVAALHRLLAATRRDGPAAEVAAIRAEARAAAQPLFAELGDALRDVLPPDGVLVADSTLLSYAHLWSVFPVLAPRTFIAPATVAIGPSLPLAVGAAVGRPDRPVVEVAGDGGFLFNIGELASLAETGADVTSVVVNDGGYGILRFLQDIQYGRRVGVDLRTPDYAAVAAGFGIDATRVVDAGGFRSALDSALASGGPHLIEVVAG